MNIIFAPTDYIRWHYGLALLQLFHIWFNFLWFVVHVFSLPLLIRTLFSPWHRLREEYGKKGGINPGDFFGSVLINLIMRIVGFIVRIVVITIGLTTLILTMLAGLIFLVLWLIAPLIIVTLLLKGVPLII
jgi:hypothetical protein